MTMVTATISFPIDIPSVSAPAGARTRTLSGVVISNTPADIMNDVTISGLSSLVDLSASITKRLDAPWAAGDGAGGLDAGAKAANATYHVHIIENSGVGDVAFSSSPVNPVLSSGWVSVARAGAVITDGSGNIRQFLQTRRWFDFMDPVVNASNIAIGATQLLPLSVPVGVKVMADIGLVPQASSGGSNAFIAVSDPDLGTVSSADSIGNFTAAYGTQQAMVFTDTMARVCVFSTNGGLLTEFTRGWCDEGDLFL